MATATSTPALDAASETGGMEGFRAFVKRIDQAVATASPGFILDSALISEYRCRGPAFLELNDCQGAPAGIIVRGLYSARWSSDSITMRSPEEVARRFINFVRAGRVELVDVYGSGEARLYALTRTAGAPPDKPLFIPSFGPLPGKDVFQAVLTSILRDAKGPDGQPLCLIYRFTFEEGRWRLFEEIVALCSDEWLRGDCPYCYDYWERWEGTAS